MTAVVRRTAEEVVRDLVSTVFLHGHVQDGFQRCGGEHVVADGELVAVHALATVGAPGDRGRVIVDLFRVADGRIVEHRDAVQPIPEHAVGRAHRSSRPTRQSSTAWSGSTCAVRSSLFARPCRCWSTGRR